MVAQIAKRLSDTSDIAAQKLAHKLLWEMGYTSTM